MQRRDKLMTPEEAALHEVSAYTLMLGDPEFIHQHVVDAWAAQTARPGDKPIVLFFALVGLYLHVEHGRTGRDAQRAHMRLARRREPWPVVPLPDDRGKITVLDVHAAPPGPERNAMIHEWARSTWNAFTHSRGVMDEVLRRREII